MEPSTAALATTVAMRFCTGVSSGRELTAIPAYTPLGGDFKSSQTRFPQLLQIWQNREKLLLIWVGALILGAAAMSSVVVAAGYRLHHALPVLVFALVAVAAEHE